MSEHTTVETATTGTATTGAGVRPGPPPLPDRAAQLVAALASVVGAVVGDAGSAAALRELAADLREESARPTTEPDPAVRIAIALDLTPFEYDLVLLAGLPEEHDAVSDAARRIGARGEAHLTTAGLAAVLGLDRHGRRHLRRALDDGPLADLLGPPATGAVPLPERSPRLPTGLWSVLRGSDHWPPGLHPAALPDVPGDPPVELERIDRALGDGAPRLVLVTGDGRDDAELAAAARDALGADGRSAVAIPAAALDADRAPVWSLHVLARGAVPVIVGCPPDVPLPFHPAPVVVAVTDSHGLRLDDRPVVELTTPRPGLGEAVALWRGVLPELGDDVEELAGLVRVGGVAARRAAADTRAGAELDPCAMSVRGVVDQVRRRTDVVLPRSVRLARPAVTLDHLVLPAEQHDRLTAAVARIRGQARVLHDWGLGAAARLRGGARVLLSGPPGTGKTLAVEAMAGELGLDLLTVDVSALVSKWLGETEKNLAEVFDAAERCQAVLFFDEADAVFGRRTDPSDGQGRWANLETAFLLGRIERADGLVVLATNLRGHIDDAFLRRLDVVVELEEPDRSARERLWRRHLPASAPYADDVDPAALAARYEITGGLIRNAALAAAFAAAAAGRRIDQDGLVAAVHDEYRKAGRSFPGTVRRPARVRGGA